jgi:hypothetical protein
MLMLSWKTPPGERYDHLMALFEPAGDKVKLFFCAHDPKHGNPVSRVEADFADFMASPECAAILAQWVRDHKAELASSLENYTWAAEAIEKARSLAPSGLGAG